MRPDWKLPMKIEHRVASILAAQERAGWQFRLNQAKQRVAELEQMEADIKPDIIAMLGYYYEAKGKVDKPFTKSGKLAVRADTGQDIGGPFTKIEWHQIELSQHQKVAARLVQLGWEPTAYTATGHPKLKVDGEPCPNLLKMHVSVGQNLAKFSKATHRKNQIVGWINACRDDGRVPAIVNPNGTNTGRMTHKIVANVPKASPDVFFGKEMRELFTHKGNGYTLVGFDAEGLELRIAAHYINNKEFTDALVNGDKHEGTDPHTRVLNACKGLGVETRDDAKKQVYTAIYGGSARKMAANLLLSEADGKRILTAIEKIFPGISSLKPRVEKAAKRGYLIGLDGRKIYMRRDPAGKLMTHKALNYLFQSGGAIAMKVVLCMLDKQIKDAGADVTFVGNIHDEVQAEVAEEWITWYNNAVHKAFSDTNKFLKLRCPLAGEVNVGQTWAETH